MELKFSDFNALVDTFFGSVDKIRETQLKASEEHSVLDQSVSDVLHSIEFGKNGGVDMMKNYKKLKELLLLRRDVKNKLRVIHTILDNMKLSDEKHEKLKRRIDGMDGTELKYSPRQLLDLNY